jgi:hypothetical protein
MPWVAGFRCLAWWDGSKVIATVDAAILLGNLIPVLAPDSQDNLWMGTRWAS